MSMSDPRDENMNEPPDVDTRGYSTDRVTFYEVGQSERWIEVAEEDTVDASDMR